MLIVYGVALFCASVLLVVFMAKMKNSPSASKSAVFKALVYTILFASVAGIIFGVAFTIQALFNLRSMHFGAIEGVLLVAVIGATFFLARKLKGKGGAAPVVAPKVPAGHT